VSTWNAIEDRSFLDSISVTVVESNHLDDEKLDWRLTVEDTSGTQFELEIWQTHDPLTTWEEGVAYEIRSGYGQTWDGGREKKLHSSKKWSVDRVDTTHDHRLLVMGDSHVGRDEHPSKPYRSIDCAGRFREGIETAISHDADCIVHTGDVFHDHVTESECETVESAFQRLQDTETAFYYVLGNHECERGNRLLREWERHGVATHLDMRGVALSDDVRLYGYDHRPGSDFTVDEMDVPRLRADSTAILVLHQTLAPFRETADVSLTEINERSGAGFDYVLSGHLHDPERPDWAGGEVLYAGSMEDLSTNPSPSDPSVWSLTVDDGEIDTRRRKL
jgi:predicted phosphodiesterase